MWWLTSLINHKPAKHTELSNGSTSCISWLKISQRSNLSAVSRESRVMLSETCYNGAFQHRTLRLSWIGAVWFRNGPCGFAFLSLCIRESMVCIIECDMARISRMPYYWTKVSGWLKWWVFPWLNSNRDPGIISRQPSERKDVKGRDRSNESLHFGLNCPREWEFQTD
jgi:hypothetical protein